jgi:hypothetical protein
MVMRWFYEDIGAMTVISRFDPDQRIYDYTWDGGETWYTGDRSLAYWLKGELSIEEITEQEAASYVTIPSGPTNAVELEGEVGQVLIALHHLEPEGVVDVGRRVRTFTELHQLAEDLEVPLSTVLGFGAQLNRSANGWPRRSHPR